LPLPGRRPTGSALGLRRQPPSRPWPQWDRTRFRERPKLLLPNPSVQPHANPIAGSRPDGEVAESIPNGAGLFQSDSPTTASFDSSMWQPRMCHQLVLSKIHKAQDADAERWKLMYIQTPWLQGCRHAKGSPCGDRRGRRRGRRRGDRAPAIAITSKARAAKIDGADIDGPPPDAEGRLRCFQG